MIKNLLTSSALVLSFTLISFNAKAQENDISVMKQQSEVLKLNADLMDKKIDWEKEKQNNTKIQASVASLNKKSDNETDDYHPSKDPKDTAKDAKNAAKILKLTESANKDLERSNNKMIDIEGDIRKLEKKLEKLKYTVELKEK
ncbi:MAG: hypothetical protein IAE62_07960 [Flavobacteriales bacterium]|nr:hypothetical protein [Flavobacteriales bacterium]MBN8623742.1 hypothetical protein [Flavobacteriales bacterium]MCA0392422.1 hypothetical protein [Bacteroidota bacterium]